MRRSRCDLPHIEAYSTVLKQTMQKLLSAAGVLHHRISLSLSGSPWTLAHVSVADWISSFGSPNTGAGCVPVNTALPDQAGLSGLYNVATVPLYPIRGGIQPDITIFPSPADNKRILGNRGSKGMRTTLKRAVAVWITLALILTPVVGMASTATGTMDPASCGMSDNCCCQAQKPAAARTWSELPCGCDIEDDPQPADLPLVAQKPVQTDSRVDLAADLATEQSLHLFATGAVPVARSAPPGPAPPSYITHCSLLI